MALINSRLRLEILVLVLLGAVALGAGIRQAPLVDWDEATYAEIAHEAIHNGAVLNFTWNDAPYIKKPPLLFWMVMASFKAFGESEWAARLPSALCGIGTMLLLYWFCAPLAGRFGGLLAGAMPLSFYFFIARGGRECATDAPLIFFSTLALFAFTRGVSGRRRWIILAGLACGLAILSKSLAGIVPLAVIAFAVVIIPAYRRSGLKHLLTMTVLAALVAGPWLLYELIANRSLFLSVFVEHETLMRLTDHVELQRQPAANTLATFLREIRHLWMLLIPLAGLIAAALKSRPRLDLRRIPPVVLVWLLWLGVALGAAGAVQTKLGWYVLPALMPVALLGGAIIGVSLQRSSGAGGYCRGLAVAALALLAVTTPRHWSGIQHAFNAERARSRPDYLLGVRARALAATRPASDLYFIGIELPTLVYYSGRRTHFVAPAVADRLQLLDLGANSLLIEDHSLILVAADGANELVGNLGSEWNFSGPPDEQGGAAGDNSPS